MNDERKGDASVFSAADRPEQKPVLCGTEPLRVLFAHHLLARYRLPVLRELAAIADIDLHLMWGTDTGPVNISILSREDLTRAGFCNDHLAVIPNHWIGRRFLWQSGLMREAASGRFDVVVMTGDYAFLSTWLTMILCRIRRVPALLWTHGALRPERSMRGVIRRTFYRLSRGLLLYGQRAVDYLRLGGLRRLPLWVIGNSLDYDLQTSLRVPPPDTGEEQERIIVYIGRLEAGKCLDLLVRAMGLLRDEAISLHMVGGGTIEGELRELAADLDVTRIHFHGPCFDEVEIASVMNQAAASVIPGDAGLSVIHALGYGVPVITHDRLDTHGPEIEAVWGSSVGAFYTHSDVEDLARVLRDSFRNRSDCYAQCLAQVEEVYVPEEHARRIAEAIRATVNG